MKWLLACYAAAGGDPNRTEIDRELEHTRRAPAATQLEEWL
jgi:hypothetical protein